jgi:hypothetical protein
MKEETFKYAKDVYQEKRRQYHIDEPKIFVIRNLQKIADNEIENKLYGDEDFVFNEGEGRNWVKVKMGNLYVEYCPGGKQSAALKIYALDKENKTKKPMIGNSFLDRYSQIQFNDFMPFSISSFYSATVIFGRKDYKPIKFVQIKELSEMEQSKEQEAFFLLGNNLYVKLGDKIQKKENEYKFEELADNQKEKLISLKMEEISYKVLQGKLENNEKKDFESLLKHIYYLRSSFNQLGDLKEMLTSYALGYPYSEEERKTIVLDFLKIADDSLFSLDNTKDVKKIGEDYEKNLIFFTKNESKGFKARTPQELVYQIAVPLMIDAEISDEDLEKYLQGYISFNKEKDQKFLENFKVEDFGKNIYEVLKFDGKIPLKSVDEQNEDKNNNLGQRIKRITKQIIKDIKENKEVKVVVDQPKKERGFAKITTKYQEGENQAQYLSKAIGEMLTFSDAQNIGEFKFVITKDKSIQINFPKHNLSKYPAKYMLSILQKEGFTKCKLDNKDQYSLTIDSSEVEKFLNSIIKQEKIYIDDLQIEEVKEEVKEEEILTDKLFSAPNYNIKRTGFSSIFNFTGATAAFGGLIATTSILIVSLIKEAKDWLIEKGDFFKRVFETLANTPWLAPVVTAISGVVTLFATTAGFGLTIKDAKDNVKDFNDKADKFAGYEKYDEISNKSWIYKATHKIEIDEGRSK